MAKKKAKKRLNVRDLFEKYRKCRSAGGRMRLWNRFTDQNPSKPQLKAIIKRFSASHFLRVMAEVSLKGGSPASVVA